MNLKTAPATILLGSLALVVLAALAWVGLIGPALDDRSATSTARTDIQDRNQTVRMQLARLREQAADLPATDKRAARLETSFPVTADLPALFEDISDLAQEAGLTPGQVLGLSPDAPTVLGSDPAAPAPAAGSAGTTGGTAGSGASTPAPGADVGVQKIQLSFEGDYDQLVDVLRGIETMPRAYLVSAVTVSSTETSLKLDVEGTSFIMPPLDPETP